MQPESEFYSSRFDEDKWALDARPILFCDPGNHLILNKQLVDSINDCSVSHELWVTDECLSVWFNQWTHGLSAAWIDSRGPHNGKRVGWHWIEKLHQPENDRRAIKLSIEGYQDFIYVFHLTPENYDQEFNMRKGVWPD